MIIQKDLFILCRTLLYNQFQYERRVESCQDCQNGGSLRGSGQRGRVPAEEQEVDLTCSEQKGRGEGGPHAEFCGQCPKDSSKVVAVETLRLPLPRRQAR